MLVFHHACVNLLSVGYHKVSITQEKSEHKVTIAARLDNLRRTLGMNWSELAISLGISRVMLHYLRTGEKPLGVKLNYRIRLAEEKTGLLNPTEGGGANPSHPPPPCELWMHTLKRRWNKKRADRDEIALAIRVLFPDHTEEILAWLNNQPTSRAAR
jgi:hypothetical protein